VINGGTPPEQTCELAEIVPATNGGTTGINRVNVFEQLVVWSTPTTWKVVDVVRVWVTGFVFVPNIPMGLNHTQFTFAPTLTVKVT
jgi:hypothetical protein